MKPRILFIAYTTERTGPTRSLLYLVDSLRQHYRISVLTPGEGYLTGELEEMGVPSIPFPSITKQHLVRLVRLLQRERFDLVYANTADRTSRLAFVAARATGTPLVVHVRSMSGDKGWYSLGHLRFASAVVAVSRATARSVSRFVPSERLRVVHNGIQVDRTNRPRDVSSLRSELGWPSECLLLLTLANLSERKGQAWGVEVIEHLRSQRPEVRLILAGRTTREPEYVETVRRRIREGRLEDHVAILGFRNDSLQLLSESDVLIHTAVEDPHPRAVLEAMAMARPVVAFAVDGVIETVVDGETGILVEPLDSLGLAQAVRRLAEEPELRYRMGEAGQRRVEQEFSAQAAASGVHRVIEEVLGRVDLENTQSPE